MKKTVILGLSSALTVGVPFANTVPIFAAEEPAQEEDKTTEFNIDEELADLETEYSTLEYKESEEESKETTIEDTNIKKKTYTYTFDLTLTDTISGKGVKDDADELAANHAFKLNAETQAITGTASLQDPANPQIVSFPSVQELDVETDANGDFETTFSHTVSWIVSADYCTNYESLDEEGKAQVDKMIEEGVLSGKSLDEAKEAAKSLAVSGAVIAMPKTTYTLVDTASQRRVQIKLGKNDTITFYNAPTNTEDYNPENPIGGNGSENGGSTNANGSGPNGATKDASSKTGIALPIGAGVAGVSGLAGAFLALTKARREKD